MVSREIEISRVDVSRIIDLRWRVLRAGLPRASASFEGDDEPTTQHFAAKIDDKIVGCATILRRAFNDQPAIQLRGMAVEPAFQGRGVGGALLATVQNQVAKSEVKLLWCNARQIAVAFYARHGWKIAGEPFDYPTAGIHYRMTINVTDFRE